MKAPRVGVRGVVKAFAPGLPVLGPLDLEAAPDEFLGIIGPSGCGKTTLLRVAAGLLAPDAGSVALEGAQAGRLPAAMVFQDLALFPWRTARENVELGVAFQGMPPADARAAVEESVRLAGLRGFEGFYPRQLSGGMRQRVALARALASDPGVFLMDEPLSSLDAATRLLLQVELARLWEARRKTVLFVTHSIAEAVFLADRVLVLTARPGRIKAEFKVPFPRPRAAGLFQEPAFAALERAVWRELEDEVLASLRQEPAAPGPGAGIGTLDA